MVSVLPAAQVLSRKVGDMGKRKMGLALLSVAVAGMVAASLAVPTPLWAEDADAVNVAKIEETGTEYPTLQAAFDAATTKQTVKLIDNTTENIVLDGASKSLTLDLNGHTLSGGSNADETHKGKAALTLNFDSVAGHLYIEDSSGTTGRIVRDDTNDGGYYVIEVIKGKLDINSGTVANESGMGSAGVKKGASLVNIKGDEKTTGSKIDAYFYLNGGSLIQKSFNALKIDEYGAKCVIKGGTITSDDQAVQNWGTTEIRGGTMNGAVAAWTYGNTESETVIDAAEGTTVVINGDVMTCNYGGTAVNAPSIEIKSGTVTGVLGVYNYDTKNGVKDEVTDPAKIALSVTGGSFKDESVKKYVADGYSVTQDAEGNFVPTEKPAGKAKIDNMEYDSLQAAVDAVSEGQTITLTGNMSGDGVKVQAGKNFTLDLGSFTYTVDGKLVGSPNTETNGLQLLGGNITIKNGAIKSDKAKILIQNYSNLKLEDVDLIGGADTMYTLSNNNGSTTIGKDTNITAGNASPKVAFDVCRYSSYPSVSVTVEEGAGTITGNIELSVGSGDAKDGASLTINGGTFTGKITDGGNGDLVTATKAENVVLGSENFVWVEGSDGNQELKAAVASVDGTGYATLKDALDNLQNGSTIKLLQNVTASGDQSALWIKDKSDITFALGGHTLTVNNTTGGGNETLNFVNCPNSRIENGTVIAKNTNNNTTGSYALCIESSDGFIVFDVKTEGGVAFYGEMNGIIDGTSNSSAVINGSNYYGVYVEGNSVVEVKNGTVNAGDGGALYANKFTDKDSGETYTSTIKVTGGKIAGKLALDTNPGIIAVSGGEFDQAVPNKFCADDFAPTQIGDGVYGVAAGTVNFWGAALRMDKYVTDEGADYTKADLRFGFNFDTPEGATNVKFGWKYGYAADDLKYELVGANSRDPQQQPLPTDPDNLKGLVANLVCEGIKAKNYGVDIYVQMYVTYTLDGKTVTITSDVENRSVAGIVDKIQANTNASDAEKTYANGLEKAMADATAKKE